MLKLRKFFFEKYGSFSDRRIKNLNKCNRFIVDTRADNGIASNGSLYGWFCGIQITVDSDDEIKIWLSGSIPTSIEINQILKLVQIKNPYIGSEDVCLCVTHNNYELLLDLANSIKRITAPGNRYSEPSYKYMCPRTSFTLLQLHGFLKEFGWESKRE